MYHPENQMKIHLASGVQLIIRTITNGREGIKLLKEESALKHLGLLKGPVRIAGFNWLYEVRIAVQVGLNSLLIGLTQSRRFRY